MGDIGVPSGLVDHGGLPPEVTPPVGRRVSTRLASSSARAFPRARETGRLAGDPWVSQEGGDSSHGVVGREPALPRRRSRRYVSEIVRTAEAASPATVRRWFQACHPEK
ncbi:hypothetical protein GCM10023317_11350 [Actinopolymorpha pittospori]